MNYVYVRQGTTCNNYSFIIDTSKKRKTDSETNIMVDGKFENNEFSCKVDSKTGYITLNGKVSNMLFVKISNVISANISSSTNKKWLDETIIPVNDNKSRTINLSVEHISGTVTGSEFNVLLRNKVKDTAILKCQMLSNILEKEEVVTDPVAYLYLFALNVKFDNYVIKPTLIIGEEQ